MQHTLKVYIMLTLAACSLAHTSPAIAASTDRVQRKVRETVSIEAQAQKQMDDWNMHRDRLLDEARTLKLELQWLSLHTEKMQRYVATNAEKIAQMELAQGRYAVAAMELEQTLVTDVQKLEAHVAASPPFLVEERTRRLDFLKKSLNDPELTIGEKYRRFTEGLNAEVEYSRKLEISNQTAVFEGKKNELIVIRAGTVGFYCLTPDRNNAGIWDIETQTFVRADDKALRSIRELETLSGSSRFMNVMELPVTRGKR